MKCPSVMFSRYRKRLRSIVTRKICGHNRSRKEQWRSGCVTPRCYARAPAALSEYERLDAAREVLFLLQELVRTPANRFLAAHSFFSLRRLDTMCNFFSPSLFAPAQPMAKLRPVYRRGTTPRRSTGACHGDMRHNLFPCPVPNHLSFNLRGPSSGLSTD